jgi:preprotein translocase subunit SecA
VAAAALAGVAKALPAVNPGISDYRVLDFRRPKPPHKGLDAAVNRWIGLHQRRPGRLRALADHAEAIDRVARDYAELSDHRLAERLLVMRDEYRRRGFETESVAARSLAAIREMADRRLGLRPFPVQLMGALALHRGFLVEMATGEGKTLTAGLAAVLAGWTGRPCHIITVNDYLVERDANWLAPLYQACGVRVGFVTGSMSPGERQQAYAREVTYATSKEVLADFLRDRLRMGNLPNVTRRLVRQLLRGHAARADGLVMRGLHTAIVDEADSVLIDEAVTPLIISSPHPNDSLRVACALARNLVADWEREEQYRVNPRYREVELTENGRRRLETACSHFPGLWRSPDRRRELITQALVAREFYLPDKQYIVQEGKIVIVDEFTGRPMPQRTWSQGLHQAIEAKAGVAVTDPTETIARLSFQRFFRCYHQLSGMTGTAREAAAEFWHVYGLPVVCIPTNRPCARQHWPQRVFPTEAAKWEAVVAEIERLHNSGRPLLVGTRSVRASECLADRLTARALSFQVLNATRLAEEAVIVACAGERGRITIATNMAGRGTDIRLGEGVAAHGGLHVLATERHESGRVDRQLFGRAARQGDPGSAQAFVSLEDELIRRHLPGPVRRWLRLLVLRGGASREIAATLAFNRAQVRAQSLAFRQRQAILRADTWLDESLAFAGLEPTV